MTTKNCPIVGCTWSTRLQNRVAAKRVLTAHIDDMKASSESPSYSSSGGRSSRLRDRKISWLIKSVFCSFCVPFEQFALRHGSVGLRRSSGDVGIGHIEKVEYLVGVHRREAGVLFVHD